MGPPWPGGYGDRVDLALIDAVSSIRFSYGREKADGTFTGVKGIIARYRAETAGVEHGWLENLAARHPQALAEVLKNWNKLSGGSTKAEGIVAAARSLVAAGLTTRSGLGPVTFEYFAMLLGEEGVKASLADLAERLGVSVKTASDLEVSDEQGTATSGAVEQALGALGLARWDIVLGKNELVAIEREALDIAQLTARTMELEGQHVPQSQIEEIVAVLVARRVAALDATAELLSSPENAKRLLRSIKDLRSRGGNEVIGREPGEVDEQRERFGDV